MKRGFKYGPKSKPYWVQIIRGENGTYSVALANPKEYELLKENKKLLEERERLFAAALEALKIESITNLTENDAFNIASIVGQWMGQNHKNFNVLRSRRRKW